LTAIALALVWAGYAAGIYGYCLVKGYQVGFADLFRPVWPGGGKVSSK
jgi:hypothetical protein